MQEGEHDVLAWLAELMKHRDAADSRRYYMLSKKFIQSKHIPNCMKFPMI